MKVVSLYTRPVWLYSVKHKIMYFEELFQMFYSYNESQWDPLSSASTETFSKITFRTILSGFKGHLFSKIHFYMVFGHKCVLAVCEHNHPTIINIHPLLMFESPLNQVSLTRPVVLTLTAVWCHISECRVTATDWQPCVTKVSALSSYAVLHFLCARAAVKIPVLCVWM